jgi:hypothetical protein
MASPLASVNMPGKKQAGSNPGNQTTVTRTKGMKRKAIKPEVPIVTGKWARKVTCNPDGNVYNVVGANRRAEVVQVEVVADKVLSVYLMQIFCKNCSEISHR